MSYQKQIEAFKEDRKKQIVENGDQIYEGKLKKLKDEDIAIVDKDSILDSEIAKIGELPRHQAIQQTFQSQPWMEYDFYQGTYYRNFPPILVNQVVYSTIAKSRNLEMNFLSKKKAGGWFFYFKIF